MNFLEIALAKSYIKQLADENTSDLTSLIASEIAKVVAEAPQSLDTLKEIADWISSHQNDAAAMSSAINTNAGNIQDILEKISSLSLVDDTTKVNYTLGIENGMLYFTDGKDETNE